MYSIRKITLLILSIFIISCGTEEVNDNSQNPNDGNDSGDTGVSGFYRFTTYQTSTADPYDVNVLFHVSDDVFRGVPNLMIENLRITENDEESPIDESSATLFDRNSFEFKMKTALLIDVSNSIQTDFEVLKDELKLLINAALPFQEIAIYTFSSTTELVQDYSTDIGQLENAIDNLELGTSSTDFYGAVVTAANSFTNGFVENDVTIGNLIIFTDGDDTQASNTFSAATEALINKNAYVVGLSSADLDEDNIRNLFGDSFYFPSETINGVNENFGLIQAEIENFANSIYLLNYETPKRGDNNHYLKVYHKENINEGADHYAVGEFSSSGFYEPVSPSVATLISPLINENITLENTCSATFEIGRSIDGNLTASDEITYEFYFGDSETSLELFDFKTVSVSQEIITFESPSGLIPQSNYYWQIKTLDDDFDELDVDSEIATFNYLESIYTAGQLLVEPSDILNSCYTKIGGVVLDGGPEVFTQDFIGFPYLTEADYIILDNVATTDFFPKLKTITKNLRIGPYIGNVSSNAMETIDGFQSLESVQSIFIGENINLTTIAGFSKLSNIETIIISRNQNLNTIQGFDAVTKLPGGLGAVALRIVQNPVLNSIEGFKNIIEMGFVEINQNNTLNSINSFESLQIVNGKFEAFNNPNLKSIDIKNLILVKGYLKVNFNILLTEINIPKLQVIEDYLGVQDNYELSLLNINNGNDFQADSVRIRDNSNLFDFCLIAGIQFIPNYNYFVSGNGYNPTWEELTNGNCNQ